MRLQNALLLDQRYITSDDEIYCGKNYQAKKAMRILNVGKPTKLIHKRTKKAATSKLVGVKRCEIHKEWFIKDLMIPVGTELNNIIDK